MLLSLQSHPYQKKSTVKFADLLHQTNELTITKHARERMQERKIQLTEEQWHQITIKLAEAKQKGVKDSLVLVQNTAFIMNADNQTVITAMETEEMKNKIFTNINGTILID